MNISKQKQELTRYLQKFRWCVRLEFIVKATVYLISFFVGGVLFLWLVNYMYISKDMPGLDYGLGFLAILAFVPALLLFGKEIYQLFIRKWPLSGVAEDFELRQSFSGDVISSADFVETDYQHHKSLETLHISRTLQSLKQIAVFRLFDSLRLVRPAVSLAVLTLVFLICSVAFSYTPYDTLKASVTGESAQISYQLEYPKKVLFGQTFHLKAKSNSDKIVINLRTGGKKYSIALKSQDLGGDKLTKLFHYKLMRVDKAFFFSLTMFRKGETHETPVRKISVYHLPVIKSLRATLAYPGIYKLPVKSQMDGNVEGYLNTRVRLELESNNQLTDAEIFFSYEDLRGKLIQKSSKMTFKNNKAQTWFVIRQNANYRIVIYDRHGNHNPEQQFFIKLLEDTPPDVIIIKPEKLVTLKKLNDRYILAEASDDYQIRSVFLYYYKIDDKGQPQKVYIYPYKVKADTTVQITPLIPLSKMALSPGDRVEYFVKAIDSGGQIGESPRHHFVYPKIKDFFKALRKDKQTVFTNLQNLLKAFKEMDKASQDIRKAKQTNKLSPAQLKKKLREMAATEKKLLEKLKRSVRKLDSLEKTLALQKKVGVSELKQQVSQIKKLMTDLLKHRQGQKEKPQSEVEQLKMDIRQIKKLKNQIKRLKNKPNSKELFDAKKQLSMKKRSFRQKARKLIKKLKDSQKENIRTPEQEKAVQKKLDEIQKLMSKLLNNKDKKGLSELKKLLGEMTKLNEDIDWDKDKYINRLEKTIERLKQLKELQNLLEARHLLKELKKAQAKLNETIKTAKKLNPLKDKAARIEKKSSEVFKKLKPAKSRSQNKANKDIKEQLKRDMKNTLKNLKGQLDKEQRDKSLESGQELEAQIAAMEQQVNQQIKQFQQRERKQILSFLRNLLLELIELRKMEGSKTDIITQGRRESQFSDEYITKLIESTLFSRKYMTRRRAQFNKNLEGSMQIDMKKQYIRLFDEISQNLNHSGQNISKKDFYYATHNQNLVLKELNKLSLMLIKLKIKTQGSGSGSGSSQSSALAGIEQLAMLQHQINKEMRQLMGQMKSGKLSKAQGKKLAELSKRQNQIGKELSKILSGQKPSATGGSKKLLGDLAEIKREIDEIKARL
ncbi:MAG: hypothetical protein OEZ36_03180, partial [Spirochaetota bacterium]|nr:hypothetical protein [Spirochaetota bacterium]